MTNRLYHLDPYQAEFTATVKDKKVEGDRIELILDQTCFYPTSGGQPFDTGTINHIPVIDVFERGDGEIVHILNEDIKTDTIEGRIDWERRFDNMQQHSGQHILSQCFLKIFEAQTTSFHLGDEITTIDITKDELTWEEAEEVEKLANSIVLADKPIKTHLISEEQAENFNLRKPPTKSRERYIRVVEVEGFDFSACGGTHCLSTGEIGLIKIRRWERKKGNTRVEFFCGWRAIKDYNWKHRMISDLAGSLTVKDKELHLAIEKLIDENRDIRRELNEVKARLLDYEAEELIDEAIEIEEIRVVSEVFEGRELGEIRQLAGKIAGQEKCIALLGLKGEKASLIFARSEDLDINMKELIKGACVIIKGRGGGRPSWAQGGGQEGDKLQEALDFAIECLTKGK